MDQGADAQSRTVTTEWTPQHFHGQGGDLGTLVGRYRIGTRSLSSWNGIATQSEVLTRPCYWIFCNTMKLESLTSEQELKVHQHLHSLHSVRRRCWPQPVRRTFSHCSFFVSFFCARSAPREFSAWLVYP